MVTVMANIGIMHRIGGSNNVQDGDPESAVVECVFHVPQMVLLF